MQKTDKEFYQSASDWAYDMYQSQTLWLRRCLVALIITAIFLVISLISNCLLIPFKEKIPYLYAFDHASGEVTTIGKLESNTLLSNEAVARYFIIHYVIQAESYDGDNVEQPYQMIWAQSSEHVRQEYENLVSSSNPNSPYRLYGKDKYITVHVNSINKLNENTVDVKFEKTLHDRTANSDQIIQKEAIIKWEFSNAETTDKMLDRDPLGFKVTYYQVSQVNIEKNS